MLLNFLVLAFLVDVGAKIQSPYDNQFLNHATSRGITQWNTNDDDKQNRKSKKSNIQTALAPVISNSPLDYKGYHRHSHGRLYSKKSFIQNADDLSHKHLHRDPVVRKSDIEAAVKGLEEASVQKNKRGFLTNLASLLTDAEILSSRKKNVGSGLSSITLSSKHISIPSKRVLDADIEKNVSKTLVQTTTAAPSTTISTTNISTTTISTTTISTTLLPVTATSGEISNLNISNDSQRNGMKKEDIPNSDVIKQVFKNNVDKDFAPIFAMYHGKIVPLGKLPENSFKKPHPVEPEVEQPETQSPHMKDVTGSRRSFSDSNEKKSITSNDPSRLSKLQEYLTNLEDEHTPETGNEKENKGVPKDEVVFPEDEPVIQRSDLMSHVKGVVLDSGKVVSVNNNHLDLPIDELSKEINPAEISKETANKDNQQKFYVSEDGTLNPLNNKAKDVTGESVARDTTKETKEKDTNDNQKTVAISLDVLKDLLKKTDTKISLASLLNKPAEAKSEPAAQSEEEDPGTIEDFAAGGIKAHNQYRLKHHDGGLIWSDDLAAKAQKIAESLADKKTLEIAKDLEKEGYGENVAKVWATFKNAGEAATKMWYSQSDNYHFDDPHLDENTGQFAQVIWKSTRELGMGVAKSIDDVNNKYVYVTALYRPPGNIEAQLRENVLPTGNNTVDVYTTFFKRTGVFTQKNIGNAKKSSIAGTVIHLQESLGNRGRKTAVPNSNEQLSLINSSPLEYYKESNQRQLIPYTKKNSVIDKSNYKSESDDDIA